MRAIIYTKYGSPDVLQCKQVDKPIPADDEILVKVEAVSVNRSDWEGLVGSPLYARFGGLLKPTNQILGSDVAGLVEAAGRNHTHFKPGDDVFGEMSNYHGGFAEYVCTRAKAWALKPTGLTFEKAAAIPQAGVIALQGLRDKIQPGQSVLINGAGGGAGSFAVQLAKLYGAEVTGVDNTGKLDFMRSLGADDVLDYTQEDFTKNGKQYDLILDLIAYRSVFAYERALKSQGSYYAVGGSIATFCQILLLGPWLRKILHKNLRILAVQPSREDLEFITGLCESGKIAIPVDKLYSLSEVPEALRYLGEGRARGKIVIRTKSSNEPGALVS